MNAKDFVGYKKGEDYDPNSVRPGPKEERRLNSNVSTVMNGLMAMNGDIRSLKRGILLLNIRLTFYAVLSALWRFLRNIKRSMWDHNG